MADFNEELNDVDMSPAAIDARLRQSSQLRRLCLSLGQAGRRAALDQISERATEYNPESDSSSKE